MSLQVEKLEKNMAKLTIEVSADELEKALQNAYKKQKNKISMPGFRKGKVPRQMVEKMYGADVFYEDAANALIPQAYSEAYDECDLQIVSQPEIDITQIEKGKPFIFTALVATRPEVTLGEYKGLEVDKVSTRVTQKEVDAKVTFPEEYHAENLQGKDAVFKCTVHEIKEKELPEIDDEFAAEVSEFDTLDEYKADVKAKIKEEKAKEGKAKKEDQVIAKAIENATMEIPELMIKTQARQQMDNFAQNLMSQGLTMEQYAQFTGMTADKMMEQMLPSAEKNIKTRLVLEAIAKAENIEISDEKIDEKLAEMAKSYDMEVEKLKELVGEAEKQQMKDDMAVQEAIDFLVENAVEK